MGRTSDRVGPLKLESDSGPSAGGGCPAECHNLASLLGARTISSCSTGWGRAEAGRPFRSCCCNEDGPAGTCLDSECTLKVLLTGFVRGADVGYKGKRGVQHDLQVSARFLA